MEQEGMTRVFALALCLGLGLAGPLDAETALPSAEGFAAAVAAYRAGDPGQAAALFHDLAHKGDGAAQFNLALFYRVGQGLPRNDREALYWAWRAAVSGRDEAGPLIARITPDIPPDDRNALAKRLLSDLAPALARGEPAALMGAAAVNLRLLDPADPAEAYFWQALAAALGVPGATAARDTTAALVPEPERPALQDKVLERFRSWCAANPAPPAACDAAS